ncbi:hypothetical protein MYOV002v2_p0185 [Vibrio phage 144E46.1]|nr:hypothetical protein MYOV002v2_p0185 [Vibrio phage 144E46.1]
MKRLTLAVDFDLTLGDTLTPWFNWAIPRCGNHEQAVRTLTTANWKGDDWVPIMKDLGVENPFEYWLQPDLCDNLEPMDYAATFLRALRVRAKERGYDLHIICVSKCVPEHIESKKRFLERECQGIFNAFIDASEKQYIDFDIIIDDSFEVAYKCSEAGKKVIVPVTSASEYASVFGGNQSNVYQWGEEYGDFWATANFIGVDTLLNIMVG